MLTRHTTIGVSPEHARLAAASLRALLSAAPDTPETETHLERLRALALALDTMAAGDARPFDR